MINFRQKQYTIQEGHYTGPKDIEKVPGAIKVVGGSTFVGAGAGKLGNEFVSDRITTESGAKTGFVAGVITKMVLNTLHNPMETVKFQEVDKCIRREFGMYRVSGISYGDSLENRKKLEERFSFNNENLTNYKIVVTIVNGKITLYTLGITDEDLEKINWSLDYYCKKYFGMEYTAKVINQRSNSYSVTITFTNHQVISNFLMELSSELGYKINLLNADVHEELEGTNIEKTYSDKIPILDKYEVKKILAGSAGSTIGAILEKPFKSRQMLAISVLQTMANTLCKFSSRDLAMIGTSAPVQGYDNKYLESVFKKLHYTEKADYTIGENTGNLNMYLDDGILLISTLSDSKEGILLEKLNLKLTKSDLSKGVYLYSFKMKQKSDLDMIIGKIMSLGIKPNIFV